MLGGNPPDGTDTHWAASAVRESTRHQSRRSRQAWPSPVAVALKSTDHKHAITMCRVASSLQPPSPPPYHAPQLTAPYPVPQLTTPPYPAPQLSPPTREPRQLWKLHGDNDRRWRRRRGTEAAPQPAAAAAVETPEERSTKQCQFRYPRRVVRNTGRSQFDR